MRGEPPGAGGAADVAARAPGGPIPTSLAVVDTAESIEAPTEAASVAAATGTSDE